jgi:hypothetical protein
LQCFGFLVFGAALDGVLDLADDLLPGGGAGLARRQRLRDLAGERDAKAHAAGDAVIGHRGLLDWGVCGVLGDLIDQQRADVDQAVEDAAEVLRVLGLLVGFGGGVGRGHGWF